jgi:MFS family permease
LPRGHFEDTPSVYTISSEGPTTDSRSSFGGALFGAISWPVSRFRLAEGLLLEQQMFLPHDTMAAIGFLGWSSAGAHSYLAWLIVTGVGCGIGNSGIWAFSQTLAGPEAAGRWTGLQNGFANLAGVVGPALTGFIVDWTGHFQAALVITAAVCLLSAISWVFLVGRLEQVVWTRRGETDLATGIPEIV